MITFEYARPWYSLDDNDPERDMIICLRIPLEERIEEPHYHDRLYIFADRCQKAGYYVDIGHSDGVVCVTR